MLDRGTLSVWVSGIVWVSATCPPIFDWPGLHSFPRTCSVIFEDAKPQIDILWKPKLPLVHGKCQLSHGLHQAPTKGLLVLQPLKRCSQNLAQKLCKLQITLRLKTQHKMGRTKWDLLKVLLPLILKSSTELLLKYTLWFHNEVHWLLFWHRHGWGTSPLQSTHGTETCHGTTTNLVVFLPLSPASGSEQWMIYSLENSFSQFQMDFSYDCRFVKKDIRRLTALHQVNEHGHTSEEFQSVSWVSLSPAKHAHIAQSSTFSDTFWPEQKKMKKPANATTNELVKLRHGPCESSSEGSLLNFHLEKLSKSIQRPDLPKLQNLYGTLLKSNQWNKNLHGFLESHFLQITWIWIYECAKARTRLRWLFAIQEHQPTKLPRPATFHQQHATPTRQLSLVCEKKTNHGLLTMRRATEASCWPSALKTWRFVVFFFSYTEWPFPVVFKTWVILFRIFFWG